MSGYIILILVVLGFVGALIWFTGWYGACLVGAVLLGVLWFFFGKHIKHAWHVITHALGHKGKHHAHAHAHPDPSLSEAIKLATTAAAILTFVQFKDLDPTFTAWSATHSSFLLALLLGGWVLVLGKLGAGKSWMHSVGAVVAGLGGLYCLLMFVIQQEAGDQFAEHFVKITTDGITTAFGPVGTVFEVILGSPVTHGSLFVGLLWQVVGKVVEFVESKFKKHH